MMKITICMPYFNRRAFLRKTLETFEAHGYFKEDYPYGIHVSICDDGSIDEPLSAWFDKPYIALSTLPKKREHKNPCVPLNKAVRETYTTLILLQSPETYHETAVLTPEVVGLIQDYKDVVLVPTRVTQVKKYPPQDTYHQWYAHPEYRPVHYWFCQLMTRRFFEEVGGFDERFRKGRSFDDNYFASILDSYGVNWLWAKDAIAVHHKHTERRIKNRSKYESNEALYIETLKEMKRRTK